MAAAVTLEEERHWSDVHAFLSRSLAHTEEYRCQVLGRTFWAHPQVMSPKYSYSPTFMIENWDGAAFAGASVLDMGCGCGVLAVFAALAGAARVVALDVSSDAVRLTRKNAEENGVADRVQVLVSDGFAALSGPLFDLVLLNAPYFDHPFDPAVPLTRGVFDPGHAFLGHVLRTAPRFLRPGGRLLLVLGSTGLSGAPTGAEGLRALLAAGPLHVIEERSEIRGHRRTLHVLAMEPGSRAGDAGGERGDARRR
jgi:methylase of polypeptide subunit release factors